MEILWIFKSDVGNLPQLNIRLHNSNNLLTKESVMFYRTHGK